MECHGVVERVENGKAWVRLIRSEKCEGCPGCGLFSSKPRGIVDLELMKVPGLVEGDEVSISMPDRRFFSALVLVFGLPILVMVAVYGIATLLLSLFAPGTPRAVAVLAAAVFGLLSFYLASRNTNRPTFEPEVTILRRASLSGSDANGPGARPNPSPATTAGGASGTGKGRSERDFSEHRYRLTGRKARED